MTIPRNLSTLASGINTSGVLGVANGGTGSIPAFSAYLNADQSVTTSTFTKVQLSLENFDTTSNFNTSTYRFTPTIGGYYQFNWVLSGFNSTTISRCLSAIYKNGAVYQYGQDGAVVTGSAATSTGSCLLYCNGSTDYVELYAFITATTPVVSTFTSSQIYTNMTGHLVGVA